MKICVNTTEPRIVYFQSENEEERGILEMFWNEGCVVGGYSTSGELELVSKKIWGKDRK